MSNDSKLGLLAGVAAVILIAVVYFQNGPQGTAAASNRQAPTKPAAAPVSALSAVAPAASAANTPVEAVRR